MKDIIKFNRGPTSLEDLDVNNPPSEGFVPIGNDEGSYDSRQLEINDINDLNTELASKAPQSNTYTKAEINASLGTLAPQADTYTKTEVDAGLSLKAPQSTTYTKTEVNNELATKASNADLSLHANNNTNPHEVTKDQVGLGNVTNEAQIPLSQKDANNGVASLDVNGYLQMSQIPIGLLGALRYQGVWNATTNSPELSDGVGAKGDYYKVSVEGSSNLDGITTWNIGDNVVFNGTTWDKIDNTDQVFSVNQQQGAVVLDDSNINGQDPTNSNILVSLRTLITNIWGVVTNHNLRHGLGGEDEVIVDGTQITTGLIPSERLTYADTNSAISGSGAGAMSPSRTAQAISAQAGLPYVTVPVGAGGTITAGISNRYAGAVEFTGVLTANAEFIVPDQVHSCLYKNSTTGGFSITVKTLSGVGVVVAPGVLCRLNCDGTNVDDSLIIPTVGSKIKVGQFELTAAAVGNGWLSDNITWDGSFWRHRVTGPAMLMYMVGTEWQIRFTPSAVANSVAGFTSCALKANANGSVGIGGAIVASANNYAGAKVYVDGTSGSMHVRSTDDKAFYMGDATHSYLSSYKVSTDGGIRFGRDGVSANNFLYGNDSSARLFNSSAVHIYSTSTTGYVVLGSGQQTGLVSQIYGSVNVTNLGSTKFKADLNALGVRDRDGTPFYISGGDGGGTTRNGGNVYLDGGTPTGSGVGGDIILGSLYGKVAIGNITPLVPLHIYSSRSSAVYGNSTIFETNAATPTINTGTRIILRTNNAGVGNAQDIYLSSILESVNGGSRSIGFGISTGDQISGILERIRISGKGNVGIGTESPTSLFQVNQPTVGIGSVSTNGTTTLIGSGTQFLNTFKVGDIITVSGETNRTIATIASNTSLTVSSAFSTSVNALTYTLTGGNRVSVLGNGNVGVGVLLSEDKLHIADNINAGPFGLTISSTTGIPTVNLTTVGNGKYSQVLFPEGRVASDRGGGSSVIIGGNQNDVVLMTNQYSTKSVHLATDRTSRVVVTSTGNIGFNTIDQFGSGVKVFGIANCTTVPTTNPTNGVVLYSESGTLKYRGSNGTITSVIGSPPYIALTDTATITWAVAGNSISNSKVTLGGNRILDITGVPDGGTGNILIIQDATGGHTITLPAPSKVVNNGNGTAVLDMAPNAETILSYTFDGTTYRWVTGRSFT